MCPFADTCDFFNNRLEKMPMLSELFQLNYCKINHYICARHRLLTAIEVTKHALTAEQVEEVGNILSHVYPTHYELASRTAEDFGLKLQ